MLPEGAVGAASMALPEARDILDVQKDAAPDRVLEQYRKIKEANDHTKGGSFYLESKVFCALESLAAEDKVLRREAVKEGLLAALAWVPFFFLVLVLVLVFFDFLFFFSHTSIFFCFFFFLSVVTTRRPTGRTLRPKRRARMIKRPNPLAKRTALRRAEKTVAREKKKNPPQKKKKINQSGKKMNK
jgi:hypothetical protein